MSPKRREVKGTKVKNLLQNVSSLPLKYTIPIEITLEVNNKYIEGKEGFDGEF